MEVSEILEIVPIENYVGQYIDDFEVRGGELWCISPFNTHEHTPSFSIRTEANVFYDFSAGFGGNLIDFITRYHNVSVFRAIQMIKAFAGIKEGEEGVCTRLEATRVAKRYKPRQKRQSQCSAKALPENYMNQYELRVDKLQPWIDEGIPWEVLKSNQVRYDAFDDRIVYPIKDYEGNIISVCGRTCDPDFKSKRIRKYTYFQQLGTVDTLYGFSDHRSSILDSHEVILFEGAKSCMKAESWGILNTCALLTSHLSAGQFKFLVKLSNFHSVRVVFALDSDVDIREDTNIKRLMNYARIEWVKNRDDILDPKDSPTDKGREVFEMLYRQRVSIN